MSHRPPPTHATIIQAAVQLSVMTRAELVALWNSLTGADLQKFSTKESGVARILDFLEKNPLALAIFPVPDDIPGQEPGENLVETGLSEALQDSQVSVPRFYGETPAAASKKGQETGKSWAHDAITLDRRLAQGKHRLTPAEVAHELRKSVVRRMAVAAKEERVPRINKYDMLRAALQKPHTFEELLAVLQTTVTSLKTMLCDIKNPKYSRGPAIQVARVGDKFVKAGK